jgi:hypothetical protein
MFLSYDNFIISILIMSPAITLGISIFFCILFYRSFKNINALKLSQKIVYLIFIFTSIVFVVIHQCLGLFSKSFFSHLVYLFTPCLWLTAVGIDSIIRIRSQRVWNIETGLIFLFYGLIFLLGLATLWHILNNGRIEGSGGAP